MLAVPLAERVFPKVSFSFRWELSAVPICKISTINCILEHSGLTLLDWNQQSIIHEPSGSFEGSKFNMLDRKVIVSALGLKTRRV